MLSVGEKTMPTFRTVILFISELFMILIKNAIRYFSRVALALGKRCESSLRTAIFSFLSVISVVTDMNSK